MLTNRKEPYRKGKVQLIDGRQFFRKMRKSLGNKRNELSPEQIDDLTRIHGNFEEGETRPITDEDPVTHEPRTRPRVVSKVFANEDFGYRKVTVERPVGRQNLMRPTDTHDANLLAAACVPPESRAPMTDAAASRCSAGRTHQAPA